MRNTATNMEGKGRHPIKNWRLGAFLKKERYESTEWKKIEGRDLNVQLPMQNYDKSLEYVKHHLSWQRTIKKENLERLNAYNWVERRKWETRQSIKFVENRFKYFSHNAVESIEAVVKWFRFEKKMLISRSEL